MPDYLKEATTWYQDAKPAMAQAAALIAICERLDKLTAQLTPITAELSEIHEGGPLWTAEDEQAAELGRVADVTDSELPF